MLSYKLTQDEIEEMIKDYAESLRDADVFSIKQDSLNVVQERKLHVKFSTKAKRMCKQLVDQCDKEIAWNAKVTYDRENNTITLDDILIFPQIVTGTTVDVEPTKYAMWVAGLDDDTVNNMRCHCHSHVNMGVFSSSTDDDYQKQLVRGNVRDYYLFLIFNKKEQVWAKLYDIETNTVWENKDIVVEYSDAAEVDEEVAQLIKDNVSTKTYSHPTQRPSAYYQQTLSQIEQRKEQEALEAQQIEMDDYYSNWLHRMNYGY